jgi:hypothetical protein
MLKENIIYYARPDGRHYHKSKDCPMLSNGQFEDMRYKEINYKDIRKRHLWECSCAVSKNIKRE